MNGRSNINIMLPTN